MDVGRIAAYGFLCGARSMAGLAALAHSLPDVESDDAGIRFLKLPKVRMAVDGIAVAEMLLDKLPGTPPRTSFLGTLARVSTGATTGVALAELEGEVPWKGAAIGAGCAFAGAWVSYGFRTWLSRYVPGWLVGVAEDAVVIGAAAYLVRERAPARRIARERPVVIGLQPEPELSAPPACAGCTARRSRAAAASRPSELAPPARHG